MEKFDYLSIQSIANHIVTVSNGKINTAKKLFEGASYRVHNEDSNIFYSSNNFLRNNLFESAFKKNELFGIYETLNRETAPINISQDFPGRLISILNELGNIVNLELEIKSERRSSVILSSLSPQRKANNQSTISAELTVFFSFSDFPMFIKRQITLGLGTPCDEQLVALANSLVNDYKPYIKIPLVDVVDMKCDLILPPGRGGILIHEAIGHALEADHFFESDGFFHGKMNKKIADSNISISDICCQKEMISFSYADDGSSPSNVDLIANGELVGVLSDQNTSRKWGIPNTGNGRSETCTHPVIPRMRNTYMHNGTITPQSIISDTRYGIYALDIGGGQVDISSGEFIFNVFAGYYIESGVPVAMTKPFLFRGNVMDTIGKIDMIGNDLSFQFAVCGKGGQRIPVSYGQPTIRIKGQQLGR